jgi:DNA-binding transcriptional regulator PaaX
MKDNFIIQFLKGAADYGASMYDTWQEMPHYYKGFHVGGPEYKRSYYGFKNLEHRGLIRIEGKKYKFTKNGRDWLEKSKIKYFWLAQKKWDKKWRIIMFDIPESMHNERNWLRRKLINLGFYMLQKSIFVFPYECSEELNELCRNAEIRKYVDILVANSLGRKEGEIKKHFQL